jgi:pimeloyl-ACP methyl ester carboxylesterase
MPIHRATTAALKELLTGALLNVVPGCGHGVHRDNPPVFNRVVLEFFEKVAAAAPS